MQSGWTHELTDLTVVWRSLFQNSSGNVVRCKLILDPQDATRFTVLCVFLICSKDNIIYTNSIPTEILNNREEVSLWETSGKMSFPACVCVCRTNPLLSQHRLNTHRVNITGLNPLWVDIGLVWLRDFIFSSPSLLFSQAVTSIP